MSTPSDGLKSFTAVVITGGSSGIGKSIIELCWKMNPELRICNLSRSKPELDLPQLRLSHFRCDLSKSAEISAVVKEVEGWLEGEAPTGPVLLINNSGFGVYGLFPEPDVDHQLEMVDVNVSAVVRLTGLLLPTLKRRGGLVLTVASTAAFQPTPYLSVYGATKAFVLNWSLGLNEELKGTGVRALAVCPGPTSTQFFRRAGLQDGSVPDSLGQTSMQVARTALKAVDQGRSLVVTGWKNKVMVAVSSRMPKALVAKVAAAAMARYRLGKSAK